MAYSTYITLSTDAPAAAEEIILKQFGETYEDMDILLSSQFGVSNKDVEEFTANLEKFSTLHPKVVFNLSGDGDEIDDRWELYVKDGKSYRDEVQIIHPKFNPLKLENQHVDPVFTQHLDMNSDDFDENTEGFDGFEIHRLVIVGVSDQTKQVMYDVNDDAENPDAWGVYVHTPEVGITCIAECDTEETAICLERMLHIAGNKFIRI